MDRVDLRDRGEQRLLRLDQAALGLQRAAGDAADRRLHARVAEIELGLGERGLRGLDAGRRDLLGGHGIVDRPCWLTIPWLISGLQALDVARALRQPRFGAGQIGVGARQRGLERAPGRW